MMYKDYLKSLVGKEGDLSFARGEMPIFYIGGTNYRSHKIIKVEDDFVIIHYEVNKHIIDYIFPLSTFTIRIEN